MVEAKLLETLGLHVPGFVDAVGKTTLARSPAKTLSDAAIYRHKSGFGLPMMEWLAKATEKNAWADLTLLAAGTPWAVGEDYHCRDVGQRVISG